MKRNKKPVNSNTSTLISTAFMARHQVSFHGYGYVYVMLEGLSFLLLTVNRKRTRALYCYHVFLFSINFIHDTIWRISRAAEGPLLKLLSYMQQGVGVKLLLVWLGKLSKLNCFMFHWQGRATVYKHARQICL